MAGRLFGVEHHFSMLNDRERMSAFQRAITRAVTGDTVVLDLGCGSGILGFFAVRAGARRVYAVEQQAETLALARELASANGLADRIEFMEGMSPHLAAGRLDPRPTLLVTEILGSAIFEEQVLEFIIDARDRLLAPGARLLPARLDLCAFACDSGVRYDWRAAVAGLSAKYELDLGALASRMASASVSRTERYDPGRYRVLSTDTTVHSIDFHAIQAPAFSTPVALEASGDGVVTSVCAYFRAHLDAETVLTNSPWARVTHWNQLMFTLPTPRAVRRGERLDLTFSYDHTLRCHLA